MKCVNSTKKTASKKGIPEGTPFLKEELNMVVTFDCHFSFVRIIMYVYTTKYVLIRRRFFIVLQNEMRIKRLPPSANAER